MPCIKSYLKKTFFGARKSQISPEPLKKPKQWAWKHEISRAWESIILTKEHVEIPGQGSIIKVEFPWVIMVFDLLCSWIFQAVPHDLAKFSRGASLFSLEFLRVKWHLKIPHGYVLRRTIPIPHLHLPPFPHPARPVNDCDCYSCLLFLAGSKKKPHLRC